MSAEPSDQQLWQQKVTNRPAARRSSLLLSIVFWVLFFAGLFWLCGVLLTKELLWFSLEEPPSTSEELFELTTIILVTVGGIIATSYLVIKHREQSTHESEQTSLERQQINHDVRAAIQQLGHDKPVIRIAGVHALVDISDEHGGEFKQRVVGVLCGYLRTDRTATDDRAVESTILQAIQEHTQEQQLDTNNTFITDDRLWFDCLFDLHGATFTEIVDFHGSTFHKPVDFQNVTFHKAARFMDTSFLAHVTFDDATFHEQPRFDNTVFYAHAGFDNATFHEHAGFSSAVFYAHVGFDNATFHEHAGFSSAVFHAHAGFSSAVFHKQAWFSSAVFYEHAGFSNTTFHKQAWFSNTTFHKQAWFSNAVFYEHAGFNDTVLNEDVLFNNAAFHETAQFLDS